MWRDGQSVLIDRENFLSLGAYHQCAAVRHLINAPRLWNRHASSEGKILPGDNIHFVETWIGGKKKLA
jgi:hypothetical protein